MPWAGTPSSRDLILDDVVATLQAITRANGYEVDVVEVTRVARDIEDEIINEIAPSASPLHQIIAGPEEPKFAGSDGLMGSTFKVIDFMVATVDDFERALRDARKAMAVDRRRGTHPDTGVGLALDTRLVLVETAEQIFYPNEYARIEWDIDYTYLEETP